MRNKMIIIIVVAVFFVGTMTGGLAFAGDTMIRLLVNDKEIISDPPAQLIGDKTFVPLRVVAESLGAVVDWHNGTVNIRTNTYEPREVKRPPIKGDQEFVEKVNAALDILQDKDIVHYRMICDSVNLIMRKDKIDGDSKNVLAVHVGGNIIILDKLVNDSKMYTPIFMAGVLTHEGAHATFWKDKKNSDYNNADSEINSYEHELTTFRLIKAPDWMINECQLALNKYKNLN